MTESPGARAKHLAEIEAKQVEARARYQTAYDANDPLISTEATQVAKNAAAKELSELETRWNDIHLLEWTSRKKTTLHPGDSSGPTSRNSTSRPEHMAPSPPCTTTSGTA